MINEINILMTCNWKLEKRPFGDLYDSVDGKHEIHSTYLNYTDALEAAKHYKYEDESGGDNFTKYWIVAATVFDKAP